MVEQEDRSSRERRAPDGPSFPHAEVEARWRNRWVEDGLYKARDDSDKPKFYVLDMYPYPSGSGLHVGHVEGYTATDIISRYKRMNGFEVLHPIGWDAFGLPTENYAIKTGRDPHEVTAENADIFRDQCVRTGFSIDWSREIDTSSEEFYKWTQQIFLDLFNNGLAYKDEAPVNWCTGCVTAIANEQVKAGHCERCDSPVESREIEQWFFRISSYADKLIEGLDGLDWPESTKEGQRNWIGRTEGVEMQLDLGINGEKIDVFTAEPELFFGVSFIAIAPEHPRLERLTLDDRREQVLSYASTATPQSETERKKQKASKGVFTGNYATNPLTGARIPIWVADYVLMDENGGAKIGVPAESQKDYDFATAHELSVIPVLASSGFSPDEKRLIFGKYAGMTQKDARKKVIEDLGEEAKPNVRYKLRDWIVSRERYWGAPIPIIHCEECGDQPVPSDQLPVLLPKIDDFTPTGIPPLAKSEDFLHAPCPNCNGAARRETKTLDTFVDSSWYFMRFADPHNDNDLANKELLKEWLPVDYYMGGADHTTGHLLYARFIAKVLYDLGRIDFTEPFTTLRHQGMVLGGDGRKMSKRWGNAVNPNDVSAQFGSDTLRLYEMFMGPLEQSKIWDTQAIVGPRRFIEKVWQLQQIVRESGTSGEEEATNTLLANVTTAINSERFNVAVSEFMKYINFIEKSGEIGKQSYETFLRLFAPFAPFITEELWNRAGNPYSIHQSSWPAPIETLAGDEKPIPILINDKFSGSYFQSEGSVDTDEDIFTLLSTNEELRVKLNGLKIKRVIHKPGKAFIIIT